MTLRLGDLAPNFTAPTTEGTIDFHEWKKGKWAVRDSEGGERTMCVRDPYQILRPEKITAPCQNVVMESAASRATVRSVCTGHGTMLTRITTDTPRQVTVEMQGVIDGQPFSETYDAKRIGDCS